MIADCFNANGAEADFIYHGDVGITGNGHVLMLERNSDALAQLIIDWIESKQKVGGLASVRA
jgi:hypothetical protein